jgi:hypothetical protein
MLVVFRSTDPANRITPRRGSWHGDFIEGVALWAAQGNTTANPNRVGTLWHQRRRIVAAVGGDRNAGEAIRPIRTDSTL